MSPNKNKHAQNAATPEPTPEPPPPAETEPIPAEAAPAAPGEPAQDPRDTEIAALKDRLIRLQADFENFRKRVNRDREDNARRACESLLKALLPIADHLELGIRAAHKHHVKPSVTEGFESVRKQLDQVFEKAGVTVIDTQKKAFDPNLHECVAHVPSMEHPENTIIEETRRGYLLGSYILRAPQVIVSSGSSQPVQPPETAGEATGSTDD